MRTIRLLLLVLLCAFAAEAQTTSVSGTITASGGQAYVNGSYTFQLVGGQGPYYLGGVLMTLAQTTITGALDSSGAFSAVAVGKTASIGPAGTSWLFTACPLASSPCWSQNIGIVSGTTLDISSTITPPAIKVLPTASVLPLAYADSEIQGNTIGVTYFNTTSSTIRVCSSLSVGVCVWSAASGGAVSSVFTRTGAVVATTGDYTCAQVTNCTATPAFSTLTASVNSNTGLFGWLQSGSFLTGTQNEYHQSILGASCPQGTIINGGGTVFVTDAMSACVNIPSGSSVTNAFSNAFGAYGVNNNSSSLGQFGKAILVGVYPAVLCNANNTKCEGISPQVTDAGSLTGVFLEGSEVGVVPQNTSDTGFGILLSFEGGTVQPTSATDNMPAVVVQTPTGGATYTSGFECQSASAASGYCLKVGPLASGANQFSEAVGFTPGSGTTVAFEATNEALFTNAPSFGIFNNTGNEGFVVAVTATANLAVNQLVKIDTAHADSFVVCTTADTSCDGFVQASNAGDGACGAAATNCPVVTVPGSKVKGIIGTSTCTIGNFVIVDTTTNGDIQCTGTPPTIGKVIGKALSACAAACAGTTIDVLTKFE